LTHEQSQNLSLPAQSNRRERVPWRYIGIMFIGSLAGSWAGILGRLAQGEGVPTPYIIAFRQVVGVLLLTPWVFIHYRDALRGLTKRDLLFATAAGACLAIHLLFGFSSLEYTTILVNGVIGGTTPIWIALIESFVLHVALGRQVWFGLWLTILGSLVIAAVSATDLSLGSAPMLGAALALGSALFGAVYSLLGRGARKRMPLVPFMWLMFVVAACITLPVVLVQGIPLVGYSAPAYVYLLLLVVIAQLVGHFTYNYVLRRVSATITAVMGQLGIVLATILAFVFFAEAPGIWEIVGSAVIVAGITIVNLRRADD
jgi:drug/metabolite transporter (DMT)-like permease